MVVKCNRILLMVGYGETDRSIFLYGSLVFHAMFFPCIVLGCFFRAAGRSSPAPSMPTGIFALASSQPEGGTTYKLNSILYRSYQNSGNLLKTAVAIRDS